MFVGLVNEAAMAEMSKPAMKLLMHTPSSHAYTPTPQARGESATGSHFAVCRGSTPGPASSRQISLAFVDSATQNGVLTVNFHAADTLQEQQAMIMQDYTMRSDCQ